LDRIRKKNSIYECARCTPNKAVFLSGAEDPTDICSKKFFKNIFVCANTGFSFARRMKIIESKYAQCLYFTSAALARKVEKLAMESWKAMDLAPSHAYLLMAVMEDPGVQPSALSAELHLKPSTITRLVEKLEEKKLVVRTYEGKLTNVYPTPKARELQPKMKNCLTRFYECYSKLLGEEESIQLVQGMAKIADKLDQ
jgi:DNA-binding MarR family transcriptional regulator